ncbi:MAG TPA: tRNA epoxyqueuosine(34) reductase QueG [Candidatus Kapabacteria bacterium]|nr:tRNA epoxyqueuosine(34) reductase QueG [Candidatus Kapabacteria bacterium]
MATMLDFNALKLSINKYAQELGFIRVAYASYSHLDTEINHYKEWIANSYNADMMWMDKNYEKREDVNLILEGAKSVIVLAHSYFTKQKHNSNENKISRYAWGDDYHDILLNKMNKLETFIKENYPDFKSKAYTDTGPILEKQWAVRSGLGWQGKNSLILNKDFGSYFFLGVIINNIPFENDNTEIDRCGTCTKCIDACPTHAIIDNKIVDANKCISFWTIEAKPYKDIPEAIQENLNGWAFGCDICQEVCPWNRHKPVITSELNFFPRLQETNFDKEKLINYTDEEFRLRFKNSPIKRTKLKGIKRNLKLLRYEMVGFGYDIHRLTLGRKLVLGGVNIDSELGTIAHSDGDVLIHSLIDALLGAAGLGDIGEHFPDTDEQYNGIASTELLNKTLELLNSYKIINIDCMIILEKPKIKEYKPLIKKNLAKLLNINESRVNIKAGTNEKLDSLGNNEACAAYSVVSIENKI